MLVDVHDSEVYRCCAALFGISHVNERAHAPLHQLEAVYGVALRAAPSLDAYYSFGEYAIGSGVNLDRPVFKFRLSRLGFRRLEMTSSQCHSMPVRRRNLCAALESDFLAAHS